MKRLLILALALPLAMAAVAVGADRRSADARIATPSLLSHETRSSADGMFVADLVGDWSPDAKAGWDIAAAALSKQIQPVVPVEVRIELMQLEPNILGKGGGAASLRNFPGAPMTDTWYPQSLASSLAGQRLLPGPDGLVWLNSVMPWDYSGDPQKALRNRKPDFVTTITHEVIHTMGIQGTARLDSGQGFVGDDDGIIDPEAHMHIMYWDSGAAAGSLFHCEAPTVTTVRSNVTADTTPDIWDRFVVNSAGQTVTDAALFPDPSPELNTFLTSNDLFWNGDGGKGANGGKPIKLYAPTTWAPGSSYAHLDDGTFDGGPDALMTAAGANIADTSLGPRLVGILSDMGWKVTNR